MKEENIESQPYIDSEVEKILAIIESDELTAFILNYASAHPDCKKALLQRFLPFQKENKANKNYALEVQECFQSLPVLQQTRRYSRYYDSEDAIDWKDSLRQIEIVLKKAEIFIEQKAFDDAATIALQVIRSIGENYIDEQYYDYLEMDNISFNCEVAGEILLTLVKQPAVKVELKTLILKELQEINKLATYQEYNVYEMDSLIEEVTIEVQTREEALVYLDGLIQERLGKPNLYQLVNRKVEILRLLERTEEANRTLDTHLYLSEIRKQVVDRLVDEKKYHDATSLLDDGIEIARREEHWGTIQQWNEYKLLIYEQTNDSGHVIDICKQIFISKGGNIKYYHKLKEYVSVDEWKPFLSTLMSQTNFSFCGWDGQLNEADIYVEEKEYDKLMGLLLRTTYSKLDSLLRYAPHLQDRYSNEVLVLITTRIGQYAEQNVGRQYYEKMAEMLRKIRDLKGGIAVVREIVEGFRVVYKRRPAMMQVLCEF
ncbi:MAG: hypothetical protein H6Q13_2677 [Bacteroidetes bacterium]|nr:hypothetical protein [Bacteroidota bacterium]